MKVEVVWCVSRVIDVAYGFALFMISNLTFSMCGVFFDQHSVASTVFRRSILEFVFDREHL